MGYRRLKRARIGCKDLIWVKGKTFDPNSFGQGNKKVYLADIDLETKEIICYNKYGREIRLSLQEEGETWFSNNPDSWDARDK